MSFVRFSYMQFSNQTFINVTIVLNWSPKTSCLVLMVSQSIIINLIPVSKTHLHDIFNIFWCSSVFSILRKKNQIGSSF